jgi:hypothetical protein
MDRLPTHDPAQLVAEFLLERTDWSPQLLLMPDDRVCVVGMCCQHTVYAISLADFVAMLAAVPSPEANN